MSHFKVKFYRDVMGLSQAQMADLLKIKQGTLSKIEKGALSSDKYAGFVAAMFGKWRDGRIKSLQEEIDYLNQL